MKNSGKRIKILTNNEIQDLYGLPKFTPEERMSYFFINSLEKEVLNKFRSKTSKIHFILQLGYFKAKKMFFAFDQQRVEEDIKYIYQQQYPEAKIFEAKKNMVSKPTKLAQQTRILELFDYRNCSKEIKEILQQKANHLTVICSKPVYIFKELIIYLEKQRILIPGYSTIQLIVGKAIANEKKRLAYLLNKHINKEIELALKILLMAEDSFYELTILKKEPKSFKYKEIMREVNRQIAIKDLYEFACFFLPKLEISNENIKYYASLVGYYTIFRLKRISSSILNIYLLCFIFNRYQKINNNLLNSLVYHVNDYAKEAKATAKEAVYNNKIEAAKNLKNASKVMNLFMDENVDDKTEFGEIRQTAFDFLEKGKFHSVCRYMAQGLFDETEYEWNHYKKLSLAVKKNLRPIVVNIEVESQTKHDPFIDAVKFLKTALNKNKSLSQFQSDEIPQDFIPKKLKRYLYTTEKIVKNGKTKKIKRLDVDKYEFLIYQSLKRGLETDDIFCRDSTQFQSLENELIDKKYWEENKDKILEGLNYNRLKLPIEEILSKLEEELETKIVEVNKRIKDGRNKYIKVTRKDDNIKWTLPYKKPEDTENHSFYSHLPQVDIGDVLHFVSEQCGFFETFTHILGRHAKTNADNHAIVAGVVALATNTGLGIMGDISDVSYQTLYTTTKNFIRLETLRDANDMVSNTIAENPFFKHYDIEEGIIHSSSDGQKFETQIKTINARHSPKYFGLKEGVSSYTLVINHVPVNGKIIGSNDHESHYVFDILYNNTSEIKSKLHSTDSHGSNKVNSFILYMFDYMFAPRYKKISNKGDKICGFKKPSQYTNCIIKPTRKVKKQLIIDEGDNVLRILGSLAFKTTTQSVIVKKLSSPYTKKNKTKKAIWEMNDIVNSIYILTYVDDLLLRQGVQKVLNRGESYHKLRKAVSHAFSGKFRVKTELEQQVWNECGRLVSNCIIFYNIWILSKLHDQLIKAGKYKEAKLVEKISPVAWRNVNLRGNFKFKQGQSVDLNKIINTLLEMRFSEYSIDNEGYFN
jgi:TnpA family transposase